MPANKSDNVTVCVRVRPLNKSEREQKCKIITVVDPSRGTVIVQDPNQSKKPKKTFAFDHAFPQDVKQLDVYNITARPIVDSVIEGYNGTIFAYGQTGTGKTFTMSGEHDVPDLRGIIPNSFAHIFGQIASAQADTQFMVRCSYLEIYCEEVRDLLSQNPQAKLKIREHPDKGVYVDKLSSQPVENADQLDAVMVRGNRNRVVGATKMNQHSSRSHAIFTILIERQDMGPDGTPRFRLGKLNLVDLAGSERQSKTKAEGQRFAEATKINLSLSTLGLVISALVDGRHSHIPYRDSVLTRLLQDSLGGNAKTTMVATFGPADYNYDETMSTLRYADTAKKIKNKPKINEDPKDALLRQYMEEIEKLKKELEGEGIDDGEEEEDSSEEEEEEEEVGQDGQIRKVRKRRAGSKMVKAEKLAAIQAEIDKDRKALLEQTNMASDEKKKIEKDLARRQNVLETQKAERAEMEAKLSQLSSKMIVGGVNLLDKAKKQQKLLEEAQKQLELQQQNEQVLQKALEEVDAEKVELERRYGSLEEEIADIQTKAKRTKKLLLSKQADLDDLNAEKDRQLSQMQEVISGLTRELRLALLVMDHFIPAQYQEEIEMQAQYNTDLDEWMLPGLAFTGNTLDRTLARPDSQASQQPKYQDEINPYDGIYATYSSSGSSKKSKARPQTAAIQTLKKKGKTNTKQAFT